MNQVIDFIVANYGYIIGVGAIAVGAITAGRKKSLKVAKGFILEAKDDLLHHAEKNPRVYANYIYKLIPTKFKAFVTVKKIEKLVVKIARDLDK